MNSFKLKHPICHLYDLQHKGAPNRGILYKDQNNSQIVGYTDIYWEGVLAINDPHLDILYCWWQVSLLEKQETKALSPYLAQRLNIEL